MGVKFASTRLRGSLWHHHLPSLPTQWTAKCHKAIHWHDRPTNLSPRGILGYPYSKSDNFAQEWNGMISHLCTCLFLRYCRVYGNGRPINSNTWHTVPLKVPLLPPLPKIEKKVTFTPQSFEKKFWWATSSYIPFLLHVHVTILTWKKNRLDFYSNCYKLWKTGSVFTNLCFKYIIS